MAPWLEEYMAALESRDLVEKANHKTYSAYARLADRTATLTLHSPNAGPEPEPAIPAPAIRPSGIKAAISPSPPPSNASLAVNLSVAQAARVALETQLSNLQASHNTILTQMNTLRSNHERLSAQYANLQTRLRDRDSELRGKNKLLENLQDELATTEMELTITSRKMEGLQEENRTLVERWMKRVGEEAEEMNVALETGERRRQISHDEEEAIDKS